MSDYYRAQGFSDEQAACLELEYPSGNLPRPSRRSCHAGTGGFVYFIAVEAYA